MAGKISAWSEMLKLAVDVRGLKDEVRAFYRGNAINALRREGWFDFLAQPRTLDVIVSHFGYTDLEYVKRFLELFVEDGILVQNGTSYKTAGPVEEQTIILPRFFGATMGQICADSAAGFPNRMRGQYGTFSEGMNLFNWDDALGLRMYEQFRRAAFKFTDALKRRGNFLDVGCGNGTGTVAIWEYYHKKGAFNKTLPMKIHGLEPDEGLRLIAEEEFPTFANRLLGIDNDTLDDLKEYHPKFVQGFAESIPYDDEFFDVVYTSQVLHWCDGERATKEMMRVLKPEGLLFGTESFYPSMDPYVELYTLLNEGAGGVIKKEDFTRWATEAGAVDVKFATPISVFKVLKG